MKELYLVTLKRLLLYGSCAIVCCTAPLVSNGTPSEHWSFLPPRSPMAPAVKGQTWLRQPIDAFVLARLEREKITPSPQAPRFTLARRVFLDLIGLPPDPELVDEFNNEMRPDSWERLVDRALASVHFGERWGRHWLDQARYADSNGYSNDNPRTIWAYRDWVIDAVNDDMPFDQFTVEQVAGDLLEDASFSQRVATGFHRNTLINEEGGSDPEQFRVESVVDRVNTTGQVWLGLTIACAQCHDHKYDPVTQREYYELFAFFNQTEDKNTRRPFLPVTPEAATELDAIKAKLEDAQRQELADRVKELKKQLNDLERRVTTMVMRERGEPRQTHVLVRGDFLRPGEPVEPDVPSVLPPLPPKSDDARTRLDLARWLVDKSNPLTARVTVNRVWMRTFGRGLVQTEEDFGTRATPPTHPKLLDWLASELVRGSWSLKSLLRTILTSATYRQSSNSRPELATVDPANRLLARQARLRLEAEIVRDVALASSGQLTHTIGGPSVYPPQPDGVYNFTRSQKAWSTSTGPDRFRRTLYTFFYRSAPYPFLTTFDVPQFNQSCTRRPRSNTPLQSLTMANNPAIFEMVRALASRVLLDVPPGDGDTDRKRLERAFQLCLARKPRKGERVSLEEFLSRRRQRFSVEPERATRIAPENPPGDVDTREVAAWVTLIRVIVNTDEFITRE